MCSSDLSIRDRWESFSRHVSFVVGDGSVFFFGIISGLGIILSNLFILSYLCFQPIRKLFFYEVLSPLAGDNDRVWSLRFHREFNDWELAAFYSLLHFIQSRIPRGGGSDDLSWFLNGSGRFGVRSFYLKIRNATLTSFPWKAIWKARSEEHTSELQSPA